MKIITSYFFVLSSFFVFSQQNEPKTIIIQKNPAVEKFDEVMNYVEKMYVDQVKSNELVDHAIISMFEKLDPHSSYISKEEVKEAMTQINGSFVGIGIKFQIYKDTLNIVSTIPGGPSQKLGIQAGDKIIKVENKNIAGVGLKNSQVKELLMGELWSKVKIDILRKGNSNPFTYVITRDNIPIYSVDCAYMLSKETGYIKLNSFTRTTPSEIQRSISKLKSEGMKNLILDLQENGGGLLGSAKELCDEFLDDNKLIVYSEGKAQPRSDLNANRKGLWEDGKLVVLINELSASASEIVSGSVQDWDRGVLVGRRSFGKGLVQRPIDLSDGSQIRLTTARYYTPSGRFIQKSYENLDEYKNDYMNRYVHGEFSNQDSIKFHDSLKFQTLMNKRTVYAGGGIMPDFFVPIDTIGVTKQFKDLVKGGYFNSFTLQYANENRNSIKEKYTTFESFDKNFEIDKNYLKEFLDFVKKEQVDFKENDKELKESEKLIKLRLKALLASDVWGNSEMYQVFNQNNNVINNALEIIESDKYYELLRKK